MTAAEKKADEEEGEFKMNIEILEQDKKKGKISFLLKGTDAYFANLLRRLIVEEVPVLAIEDVEFKNNDSALYDEIVAHRLGLIPINTDLKSYNLPEDCTCKGEGCAKCQLKMVIKANKMGYVYSEELKSKDPKCVPVYPKMPITKLFKGQKLELEATAVLGKGKQHAKWVPCLVSYYNNYKITIDNSSKKFEDLKGKYPPQIFDKSGKISKDLINTPELVDTCKGICDEIVNIEEKEDEFIFMIESWGQLEPKQIVSEAVNQFKQKAQSFKENLKSSQ